MSTRSAFSFTSYRSGKSVNTNTSRSRSGFTDASERTDQSSPDSLLHAAEPDRESESCSNAEEVSRLHMAQAQIQGMWMLQRRASNFTPLEESCVQSYAINLVDSDSS